MSSLTYISVWTPDCMELTEMRMQLSRRLIVVLTPGITGPQEAMTPHAYDWQVGLYQVLVQQGMSAILIQLGDMTDYSRLPLGLQHLLQKNPPLKWNEGSRNPGSPSSRFWKQVRYMMPVVSAQQCSSNSRWSKFRFWYTLIERVVLIFWYLGSTRREQVVVLSLPSS